MSFLSDLGDTITGQTGVKLSQQQLQQQLGFNQAVLAEQQKEAELKYNPTLQAEKNKMYIAIAIVVGIVTIVLIRKLM